MKTFFITAFLLAVVSLPAEIFVLNTISQTVSRIDLTTQSVNNTFALTGLYPNKMAVEENYIYLTNSGDNNLRKIEISTGVIETTIALENYSNPYDIVIYESFAYVTGMLTNKVYKLDTLTDNVVDEIAVGVAPTGLLTYNGLLYVANSGFQYPSYHPGELTVIDLQNFSVLTTISVPLNPQRMIVDDDDYLHLVCTGDYGSETGTIVIIDTMNHEVINSIPLTIYPANIAITPLGRVYVGDAFGGGLFAYDTPSLEIVHSCESLFSAGGSAITVYAEYLLVADAAGFVSNSVIRFYNFQEELVESYQSAIGAIDIVFPPFQTDVTDEVIVKPSFVSLYPNPFRDEITILVAGGSSDRACNLNANFGEYDGGKELTISIYNLKGQLVRRLSTAGNVSSWDGMNDNGESCPAGIYLFRIYHDRVFISSGKITLIR